MNPSSFLNLGQKLNSVNTLSMTKISKVFYNALLIVTISISCNKTPQQKSTYISHHTINQTDTMVLSYLRRNLQGYSMVLPSEMNPLWWSLCPENKNPIQISTDLNDDGITDHAFFLKKDSEYVLCLLKSTKGNYSHFLIDGFTKNTEGLAYGLSILPPQQVDLVVNNEEVSYILRSNSISVSYLEKPLFIFYFENKQLQRISFDEH
jgi:hypothetical protein